MTSRLSSLVLALLVLSTGCVGEAEPQPATFVREVPWADAGVWVAVDTHVHTRFSDGGQTVDAVVAKALENGLDAIAITDHADRNLSATSPEYVVAIESARAAHPDLTIIAGIEWNIPPFGGDEHATILVPSDDAEWSTLSEMKARYDDLDRGDSDELRVDEALAWLTGRALDPDLPPVVIYNHPSRSDEKSLDNADDIRQWSAVSQLVIGFEGAPGHQGATPIGSYSSSEQPIDRWDPVAARIGDAWDRLLREGFDIGAAHAASDFHGPVDYWPGQFSRTWLYVPDRTVAGVLRGLRARTGFATHGHIVENVTLTVSADGLRRPATVGEAIEVSVDSQVLAELSFDVPSTDWAGEPNQIDEVELIAITLDGATSAFKGRPAATGAAVRQQLVVPVGGLVVRARGRRVVADGPDLMFYTNPIRIRTR